jgi:hypothetical protein
MIVTIRVVFEQPVKITWFSTTAFFIFEKSGIIKLVAGTYLKSQFSLDCFAAVGIHGNIFAIAGGLKDLCGGIIGKIGKITRPEDALSIHPAFVIILSSQDRE